MTDCDHEERAALEETIRVIIAIPPRPKMSDAYVGNKKCNQGPARILVYRLRIADICRLC